MDRICMCINELNFENQSKKHEDNSNPKTIICNGTQHQLVVTSLSEIEILSSTHR
jgi:hypothetical protein